MSDTSLVMQARKLIRSQDSNARRMSSLHGTSTVYQVTIEGSKYVHKKYNKKDERYKTKRAVLAQLERGIGALAYRRRPDTEIAPEEITSFERRILETWEDLGISAPRVVESTSEEILITYIEGGRDHNALITQGEYTPRHKSALLETLKEIREKARSRKDRYGLHPDPTLSNMLDTPGGTVPIDPGLVFRKEIDFDTLDAGLNLSLCYSLITPPPIYHYEGDSKEIYDSILRAFLRTLDQKTRDRMRAINKPANRHELMYLRLATEVTSRLGERNNRPSVRERLFGIDSSYYEFIKRFDTQQTNRINEELKSAA